MYETITGRLTRAQTKMLLEHIDGSRWIDAPLRINEYHPTRRGLMALGLIEFRRVGYDCPRFTYITEKGRSVLARVLSDYADALIAAGYQVEQRHEVPPDLKATMVRHFSIKSAASILPDAQDNRVAVGAD